MLNSWRLSTHCARFWQPSTPPRSQSGVHISGRRVRMRLLANLKTLVVMAVAVAGIASRSDAGPIPAGLNPGDKYRLVFVTSTTTDATSPDISYYKSFVTNMADAFPEFVGF